MEHPVGRISKSDWFVNSFITVVYEKISFSSVRILESITILFKNQSELGCESIYPNFVNKNALYVKEMIHC